MFARTLATRLTNVSTILSSRSVHIESKIASLGLQLPTPAIPKGAFVNFTIVDNLVYLSGYLPQPAEGALVVGKVGKEISVEEGYEAAKYVGLNLCATLKHHLGDLDKIERVVKVLGFVNCVDGFSQQPAVINGCSDLFLKVFGSERGAHVRSALGTNSLPLGVAVEIEAVFQLKAEVVEELKQKGKQTDAATESKPAEQAAAK